MTRAVATARSVALGVGLGAAVAAVVSLILIGPASLIGGIGRGEVKDSLVAFFPAGILAGLTLGCIAPFVKRRRQGVLFLATALVYPLSTLLAFVLLMTERNGSLPAAGALVTPMTLFSVVWAAVAYVPVVGGPAVIALLVLERLTRPKDGSP